MMKRDFTLIELLLVTSIIAVLAAMLLPSLNKARQMAVSSRCIGNLKQCVMALSAYADDNRDCLPPAMELYGDGKSYGWGFVLTGNKYLPSQEEGATTGCVLRCPSQNFNGDSWSRRGENSYGLISGLENFGDPVTTTLSRPVYRIRRKVLTSDGYRGVPLGGDSRKGNATANQQAYIFMQESHSANIIGSGSVGLHLRHSGAANVFYVDGHVSKLSMADLNQETKVFYSNASP